MGKRAREKVKNGIQHYPRKFFRATTDKNNSLAKKNMFLRLWRLVEF